MIGEKQPIEKAAELLCRTVRNLMQERVVSVILHGSAVLDDLALGYSDLDFLVVQAGELSEDECQALKHMRAPFLSGQHGPWAKALEGAFLPRPMLNPAVTGRAFWWGTSSERVWDSNKLGWFTLWVIREKGLVLWGEDTRQEIPIPPKDGLVAQVNEFCASARQHGRGGSIKSVDWLLTAARLLKWVREGVMSSKSDAADWAFHNAKGQWRELLPAAKDMRLHVELAETSGAKAWLDGLQGPITDACQELELALTARTCSPDWRGVAERHQ